MSSRPFIKPHLVIENGDMSGNLTSAVTIINQLSMISYMVEFTGTPTGDFSVQVSNNYKLNAAGGVEDAGDWVDLPLTGDTPEATGSPDYGFIDVSGLAGYATRLVYTRTSGTGTLNAYVCSKVM